MNEESHQWLKANDSPQKVAAIISMQEQMVETRAWKQSRGLQVQSDKCRLCGEVRETVMHMLSRCKVRQQGNKNYTKRHKCAEDACHRMRMTGRHTWTKDIMVQWYKWEQRKAIDKQRQDIY